MNFLSRLLAYRTARKVTAELSGVGSLVGGIVFGFLAVVCGLILVGGLIELLT